MKDRTGDEIPEPEPHDPTTCPKRWEDADGTPVFCVTCRPDLDRQAVRFRAGLIDYPPASPEVDR